MTTATLDVTGEQIAARLLWARRVRLDLSPADAAWAIDCARLARDRQAEVYDQRAATRWNSYEIDLHGRTAEVAVCRYLGASPEPPEVVTGRRNDGGVDVPGWDVGVKCSLWSDAEQFAKWIGGRLIIPLRRPGGLSDTYVQCVYLTRPRELYLAGFATAAEVEVAPRLTSNPGKPAVEIAYWRLWPIGAWTPKQRGRS